MVTAIDQVSPLVGAQQHVRRDDPGPRRRPGQRERDRNADEPPGEQEPLAAEPGGERPCGEVGSLYRAGHIPGAVSIPVADLADRINELPADTELVVYCRGEYCVLAYDALRLLTGHGRRAIRLHDGMLEWRLADLPVHTADPA